MEKLNVTKVSNKPTLPCAPNTLFLQAVTAQGGEDQLLIHLSSADGSTIGSTLSETAIGDLLSSGTIGSSQVVKVANITSRDALSLTANRFVVVTDASDDSKVSVGEAVYLYDASEETHTLIRKREVELGWPLTEAGW